jgi:sulfate permease, SulP family
VVLRLKRVRNPDAVCLELFERFLAKLEQRRISVLFCGVRDDLARVLRTSGLEQRLGPACIFREADAAVSSTLEAVRRGYELLQDDVCETCPRRGEMTKEVLYYMI